MQVCVKLNSQKIKFIQHMPKTYILYNISFGQITMKFQFDDCPNLFSLPACKQHKWANKNTFCIFLIFIIFS
jgi:hypothetical protein